MRREEAQLELCLLRRLSLPRFLVAWRCLLACCCCAAAAVTLGPQHLMASSSSNDLPGAKAGLGKEVLEAAAAAWLTEAARIAPDLLDELRSQMQ